MLSFKFLALTLLLSQTLSDFTEGFNPRVEEEEETVKEQEKTEEETKSAEEKIIVGKFGITFDTRLRCGACINAGWIFCYKRTGGIVDASSLDSTNSICCTDT